MEPFNNNDNNQNTGASTSGISPLNEHYTKMTVSITPEPGKKLEEVKNEPAAEEGTSKSTPRSRRKRVLNDEKDSEELTDKSVGKKTPRESGGDDGNVDAEAEKQPDKQNETDDLPEVPKETAISK